MSKLLVLRPQPGADRTAGLIAAMGLEPVVAPIFEVRPLDWTPPAASAFDAVLLTSANAAGLAGDGLTPFLHLPCFAVGAQTAAEARARGFSDIRIGDGNAADLLAAMANEGVRRAFHPCGRDHRKVSNPDIAVTRLPVYAAVAAERLPATAGDALGEGAVALIHSPRAGGVFAELAGALRSRVRIVAISPAAAAAAGPGWRAVAAADVPSDRAMLELAAKLCQNAWREEEGRSG